MNKELYSCRYGNPACNSAYGPPSPCACISCTQVRRSGLNFLDHDSVNPSYAEKAYSFFKSPSLAELFSGKSPKKSSQKSRDSSSCSGLVNLVKPVELPSREDTGVSGGSFSLNESLRSDDNTEETQFGGSFQESYGNSHGISHSDSSLGISPGNPHGSSHDSSLGKSGGNSHGSSHGNPRGNSHGNSSSSSPSTALTANQPQFEKANDSFGTSSCGTLMVTLSDNSSQQPRGGSSAERWKSANQPFVSRRLKAQCLEQSSECPPQTILWKSQSLRKASWQPHASGDSSQQQCGDSYDKLKSANSGRRKAQSISGNISYGSNNLDHDLRLTDNMPDKGFVGSYSKEKPRKKVNERKRRRHAISLTTPTGPGYISPADDVVKKRQRLDTV